MTDKEIIINGIDVSGCGYYYEIDGQCNIFGMGKSGEDTFCRYCTDNPNCYYKKLKQLEQENAELKAYMDVNEDFKTAWEELKAENERLKEENYQLQKDCQICENFIDFIPCKPIRDMDYDLQKVISQRDKYYQTLQEIEDIAMGIMDDDIEEGSAYSDARQILDLITKAEVE